MPRRPARPEQPLEPREGEVLGSVPREIVRTAVCDVTIIQTGGNGESQHYTGRGSSAAGGPP